MRLCPDPQRVNRSKKITVETLSGDNRGGFLHFANASVEMTLKSDKNNVCENR